MHFLPGKRSVMVLLAIVALAFLVPGQAAAIPGTFYSTFMTPNDKLTVAAPYADLTINVLGPTATFTVTAADSYLIGDKIGLQLTNTSGVTAQILSYSFLGLPDIIVDPLNPPLHPEYQGVALNTQVDGFGNFNTVLQWGSADADRFHDVEFTLTLAGSATWADAFSVLMTNGEVTNPDGYDAALHVFPGGGLLTGYAGELVTDSGPSPIPLPPSALLLGSGLVGLVGLGWRRRKTNV